MVLRLASGCVRSVIKFDLIETDIFVGTCLTSTMDVNRLARDLKVTAVLCLQSDKDFKAYHLPIDEIREACRRNGISWVQRSIIDFDPEDMARGIHEPVDALNELLSSGKRVYVHCTVGICRAPGTIVGYLHKYRGMSLDAALELVKLNRPIADPYMSALKIAFNQEHK